MEIQAIDRGRKRRKRRKKRKRKKEKRKKEKEEEEKKEKEEKEEEGEVLTEFLGFYNQFSAPSISTKLSIASTKREEA